MKPHVAIRTSGSGDKESVGQAAKKGEEVKISHMLFRLRGLLALSDMINWVTFLIHDTILSRGTYVGNVYVK